MQQGVQLKKLQQLPILQASSDVDCTKPLLVVASSSSRHRRITTSIPTTHLEAQSTTTRMLNDLLGSDARLHILLSLKAALPWIDVTPRRSATPRFSASRFQQSAPAPL